MRVILTGLLAGSYCLTLAGLGDSAARGDDKPAKPAKGYELRIVTFGDIYRGIRFKPTSGESWQLLAGRWKNLEETAPPPPGDYDVLLLPVESLLAFRLDRATGTTWLLRGGKWTPIKEPLTATGAEALKPGPGCALRHVRLGKHMHVIRFHAKTGATWHINGATFDSLAETGHVPAGDYDITMIAGEKNWMAFRIDRKSGKTWMLQANKWNTVAEPK